MTEKEFNIQQSLGVIPPAARLKYCSRCNDRTIWILRISIGDVLFAWEYCSNHAVAERLYDSLCTIEDISKFYPLAEVEK